MTDDPDQKQVLAFLGRSSTTSRIDTHASIVFLEPDRVLKIKRAVRLPFLDFSTLDKRKHACEEELAVNRRHAPSIYRRVVPITRGADGFHIGGDGDVVEWAVEMARFDERRTFDHLAKGGRIAPELAEAMADMMLASHHGATLSDGAGWLASIGGLIDRNSDEFRHQSCLVGSDVERLHVLSHLRLMEHFAPMQRRAAAGLVRRCHGDAHLGNIVLIDGKPLLFDAIEFDPAIATTDVLYDLAFPLMDLVHFDQGLAANRLFNRYLGATWQQNADAVRLLPLFSSIRAAIRANVLFVRHEQSADDLAALAQAQSYFNLALRLIAPEPPSLVAIGGRSGTGKTVLARAVAARIAPAPGAVVLRTDVIRKELFGVDPLAALPESAHAPDVTERVYRIMSERGEMILRQGLSVVFDAAFLADNERNTLAALAASAGANFCGLFLDAPSDIRLQRIASRRADASDAGRDVALLQEGFDIGRLDWPIVDASSSPTDTFARAMTHLRKLRKDTE
jgi:aminoglycoside phosphotransferase family enzyme/predicted kinase